MPHKDKLLATFMLGYKGRVAMGPLVFFRPFIGVYQNNMNH